jgi:hypothetical protein
MPRNMTIERETAWNSAPRLVMKLHETPSTDRSIFKDNASQKSCYSEMIAKLNSIEERLNLFGSDAGTLLGPLIRMLWKKHEKDLRVGNYELDINKMAYCEDNKQTGEWEVHINLERDRIAHDEWNAEHDSIFHEFFHNIFAVADIGGIELAETDIVKRFGEEIETEANTLLSEENDKNAPRKRLKELTFYKQKADRAEEKRQKKYRAAMFDILGAVFYRGKYGCYPPNSKYYNEGIECKKKKLVCETTSKTNPEAITCPHRDSASRDLKGYDYCSKAGECKFKSNENKGYKKNCDLEINDWCDEIFGHGVDYWESELAEKWNWKPPPKQWKKDTSYHPKFLKRLAEETFVHMATNAIVSPEAYKKMAECLPCSEMTFIEILEGTLSRELAVWSNIWESTVRGHAE